MSVGKDITAPGILMAGEIKKQDSKSDIYCPLFPYRIIAVSLKQKISIFREHSCFYSRTVSVFFKENITFPIENQHHELTDFLDNILTK